jgi:hypothetical protein
LIKAIGIVITWLHQIRFHQSLQSGRLFRHN